MKPLEHLLHVLIRREPTTQVHETPEMRRRREAVEDAELSVELLEARAEVVLAGLEGEGGGA